MELVSITKELTKMLEPFKYLVSFSTNHNSIHEEIKFRFKQEIHVIILFKYIVLLEFSSGLEN